MDETLEYILKSMNNDLERSKKELAEAQFDSIRSWFRGEINTLERYIEFIKNTVEL
jgi:hypothetical protein